jgi:hypothetical protein
MDENCKEEIYFVSMMILSVLSASVYTSKPENYPRGSKDAEKKKKKYCFYDINSCADCTVFVVQA